MAENVPYVGEIRLFPFEWAPYGWLPCDGRMVEVREYPMLSALISGTYGPAKDGKFTLPDLRGRALYGALSIGTPGKDATGTPGSAFGEEEVVLLEKNLPAHGHTVFASSADGKEVRMDDAVFSKAVPVNPTLFPPNAEVRLYGATDDKIPDPVLLNPDTVSKVGGGKAHDNMQPFLALQYCICVAGDYPVHD